ncbi:MAG TPA: acyl-[acyl-carrier-protein]--UDP-N-acetylglucosamine O-acyltransferase, partial [Opitutae bacterium]|nr:acyl-[acyl-carrier-protein]--UDP-N-acetylglucosamine O-acyltransferase [Opitutae bacterium]
MSVKIHSQAIVDSRAQLGEGVEIGPFCYIGGGAVIGDHTRVLHHATIEGKVTLGR